VKIYLKTINYSNVNDKIKKLIFKFKKFNNFNPKLKPFNKYLLVEIIIKMDLFFILTLNNHNKLYKDQSLLNKKDQELLKVQNNLKIQ